MSDAARGDDGPTEDKKPWSKAPVGAGMAIGVALGAAIGSMFDWQNRQ